MSRFDYVKYDEKAQSASKLFKTKFETLEGFIETELGGSRAKALVLTKLEEAYMWIGKAIRDEQIQRNGSAELLEERNNG